MCYEGRAVRGLSLNLSHCLLVQFTRRVPLMGYTDERILTWAVSRLGFSFRDHLVVTYEESTILYWDSERPKFQILVLGKGNQVTAYGILCSWEDFLSCAGNWLSKSMNPPPLLNHMICLWFSVSLDTKFHLSGVSLFHVWNLFQRVMRKHLRLLSSNVGRPRKLWF